MLNKDTVSKSASQSRNRVAKYGLTNESIPYVALDVARMVSTEVYLIFSKNLSFAVTPVISSCTTVHSVVIDELSMFAFTPLASS